MGASDLSAYLWPEGQIPSEARLRPEYFDDAALCFVFNSTEPINLARNNYGKRPTRTAAALKIRAPGLGVGCNSTTRSYLDNSWPIPIRSSLASGVGAFSILIRATLASSATRGFPLHVRYNDLPYNSIFVQQNGYYADGGASSVNEAGSVWIGTYSSTNGAQGLKIAGLLTAAPKDCTFLFNRFEDGAQELWLNGQLVASNTVSPLNQLFTGSVQILSIGGNGSATGFPAPDPIHLLYAANKAFSASESAELSANSSMLFLQDEIPFPVFEPSGALDVPTLYTPAAASAPSATVDLQRSVVASFEPASANGHSANVDLVRNIACALGTASASGNVATVTLPGVINIPASLGVASATGHLANVNLTYALSAETGTAVALGFDAALNTTSPPFTQVQLDYLLAYMQEHLMIPTKEEIAAAVIAAMNAAPPAVDAKLMNGAPVVGDGSEANPWRGVGVPA